MQNIKKRRPKGVDNLSPKDLKPRSDAYDDYALPIQQRRRDGLVLKHRISNNHGSQPSWQSKEFTLPIYQDQKTSEV